MFRDDEPMGTNKRYAHLLAQRGEERELREAREHGPLRTLTRSSCDYTRSPSRSFPSR